MNFTCIGFGIVFFLAGALFAMGKLHIFMRAWKEMPQDEKDKILIEPLCRNIGWVISLSGIIFMLNGIYPDFRNQCFVISMVIWLLIAGADLLFIEKSKKYQVK